MVFGLLELVEVRLSRLEPLASRLINNCRKHGSKSRNPKNVEPD
jgi:hypothetical protein